MAYKSFFLKKLAITKLPGFSRGLKDLDGLGENINIVYGPNASGKSSTARIIQQLIWQKDTHGIDAKASIKLGDEPWNIHINSSHVVTQQDGIDKELIGIPSVESKRRYLLELSGLMLDAESNLAQKILQASNGGYNLNSARDVFNYSPKPKSSTIGEVKAYENSTKAYNDLLNEQKKLKGEQEKLVQLERERTEAEGALKEVDFYNQAIARLNAKLEYERLKEEKNKFPEAIKEVTKGDADNIVDFEENINNLSVKIESDKKLKKGYENRLNNLNIGKSGVSSVTLDDLTSRIERLKDFETEHQTLTTKIKSLSAREEEVLKNFNSSVELTDWKGINLSEIKDLDKHIREAYPVLATVYHLESEIGQLEGQTLKQEHNPSGDTLKSGIEVLGKWLKESDGVVQEKPKGLIILLALSGILTGGLVYFTVWGFLGIVAILIVLFALLTKKTGSQGTVQIRENDFIKLGLALPKAWNTIEVAEQIDQLIKELHGHNSNEVILSKIEERKNELHRLSPQLEAIYVRHKEWLNSIQATPELPDFDKQDFSSLYWFMHNLKEWQAVYLNKEELISELTSKQKAIDEEITVINDQLKENNYEEARDYIRCKALVQDLAQQKQIYDEAKREIQQLDNNLEENKNQKKTESDKLSMLYKKLNIEEGKKDKVRELINQMAEFQTVSDKFNIAKSKFEELDVTLKNHSIFKTKEHEVDPLSLDELADKKRISDAIAQGLEETRDEITRIKVLVNKATNDTKLEDALVAQDEAIEGLEAVYLANLSSVTGNLIINELKNETETKNRPAIFKRADELLGLITNGRYQLRLSEHEEETNFRAFDTVSEMGLDLSELSDGTRVQLLLAVRLAYIESIEENSKIKLPILADELLANSDDLRARAIIEALIKISKEGRQIFYFTAQADEVRKWQQYLNENQGLDNKIHSISEKELYYSLNGDSSEILKNLHPNLNPPSVEGLNHEEYGKKIEVGPYNLISQRPSEIHLWYLIEDIHLLHQCLTKGIMYWGQLKNFYENKGRMELLTTDLYHKIKEKAIIIGRFQELYQHGRVKPVDRIVLEKSNLITAAFIDEVSNKLEELEGHPIKLIEALENREVSKFRKITIDELQAYFIEHGYIDERAPLSAEDIRISMSAFVSNLTISEEEAEDFYRKFY